MGVAASLFFSTDTEKETLSRRIIPSDEQFQEQQDRWNALADYMKADLAERVAYAFQTWLQGSYKFGTQVRPPSKGDEFDIDLGIYMVGYEKAEDEDVSAKELKEHVQESLKAYATANLEEIIEVVPPKSRCCRIRFRGDFHIDVPAYHLRAPTGTRLLATKDDEWIDSDPKAFYLWFKDVLPDAVREKARRHIRYLKCWAGLKLKDSESKPSSVLLTVLVTEAIQKLELADISSDDDGFKAIIESITARLHSDTTVKNPANNAEILSDRMSTTGFETFLDNLEELKDIAERGANAADKIDASDIWAEAFDHFFPAPEITEIEESANKAAASQQLALIRFDPIVKVVARNLNDPSQTWENLNRIGPIPRGCSIDFSLVNSSQVPRGASISWMVRNQGKEAEYQNDLGHRKGNGITCNERSAYVGVHYMDCIIRLGSQIVGFKRVPVQITGMTFPKRNPISKPAYTKLMGRR